MRLVFIRLDHLGDILLCTPMIRTLAEAGHEIEVVIPVALLQVFANSPFVKRVHAIEELCPEFPSRWWRLGRWISKSRFEGVLVPHGRDPGVLLASMWSRANVRVAMWGGWLGRVTGHRCLRSGLLQQPRHFSEIMMDIAREFGVKPGGPVRPDLFPSQSTVESVANLVSNRVGTCKLIGVHPGSLGNACNMPSGAYAQIIERLLERDDVVVVVTGTLHEGGLVSTWSPAIIKHPRFWNSMGKLGIHELAVLVKHMAVYVVPSTGPLHVAAWAGTKTVSPFCASPCLSPVVWGNVNGNGVNLTPPETYCTRMRHAQKGHCDFGGQVTADMIFEKVCDVL